MKPTFIFTIVLIAIVASLGSIEVSQAAAPGAAIATRPKISKAMAAATALKWVPAGIIQEGDLEEEKGRLVWSFDIAVLNSANIIEVQVDAVTGSVISVVPETPTQQATEANTEAVNIVRTRKQEFRHFGLIVHKDNTII
jgi:hypothetical protein